MSNKRLARHVTVAGVTYAPGDDVPADIAKKITNPKAWVTAAEAAVEEVASRGKAGTKSGHKLATTVTVGSQTYGPTDFVPDDVAVLIKNPKAWAGGKLPTPAKEDPATSQADTGKADDAKTSAPTADGPDGSPAETKETADAKANKPAPPAAPRRA